MSMRRFEPVSIVDCFAACSETAFLMAGDAVGFPTPRWGRCPQTPSSLRAGFKQAFYQFKRGKSKNLRFLVGFGAKPQALSFLCKISDLLIYWK